MGGTTLVPPSRACAAGLREGTPRQREAQGAHAPQRVEALDESGAPIHDGTCDEDQHYRRGKCNG
jgi:hypothetical protein